MGTVNSERIRPGSSPVRGTSPRAARRFSTILFLLGVLVLLAALAYAGYTVLNMWVIDQDRYLMAHEIAPLPALISTHTPDPTRIAQTSPSATPSPTAVPTRQAKARGKKTPMPTATASPTLAPTWTPSPTPTAVVQRADLPPPVRIRIPKLGVNRSIISLPRAQDGRTGALTWNTDRLFRSGRRDLVGHSQGSANPGQQGNMILVGHNYGYGYNGVFVGLGRLRPGQQIYVVNEEGQSFSYRVTTVQRVKWRRKSFGELTQHLNFLATGGPERLTLVSCSGADVEPFPERIYVVAEPVR